MNEALIAKIRNLLAKTTDSGCSQAEAEAAYNMAAKIMAAHNLDMAEVNATSEAPEEWEDGLIVEKPQWTIEMNLAASIAHRFFFVENYRSVTRGGRSFKLMFFGKPENVETARHVYHSLMAAFARLWGDYRVANRRPVSERRLYIVGIAEGFSRKLQEERDAEKYERDLLSGKRGGTEIALANIAEQTKRELATRHKITQGKGCAMPKGNQSTLEAGIAAGRNLNLNRGIGGSGRKAIGG